MTRHVEHWSEEWVDPQAWVRSIETALVSEGAVVRRGSDFDRWDLETRGGTLAGVRLSTLVEEHAGGRALARARCRPVWSRAALVALALLAALAAAAAVDGAAVAALVLALLGGALAVRSAGEASSAMAITVAAVERQAPR